MLKKYAPYLPQAIEHYVEPFLGAGAMFKWVYEKNPNAEFVLNDSNESVMRIYGVIKHDVKQFLVRLEALQEAYLNISIEQKAQRKKFYYDLRHEHAYHYDKWSPTEESATLYFLMKTGFNGIWQINKNTNNRFGTPAGLLNQPTQVYCKENILEWHKALQRCKLLSVDFKDTLKEVHGHSYVYLDPPYRGSFTKYGVDFDDETQREVVKYVNDASVKGAHVLMSNRDTGDGFFEGLQGNNKMVYFDVKYTAGRRKKDENGNYSAKKAREFLMIGNCYVPW